MSKKPIICVIGVLILLMAAADIQNASAMSLGGAARSRNTNT